MSKQFDTHETMKRALRRKGHTLAQLAALTGLSHSAVSRWLTANTTYVCGYEQDARGRLFTRVWRWGTKPSLPRPGPQRTAADRMRDVRARRKGKTP
jgi:hypothetical protein